MKHLRKINEDFYSLENESISNIKDFLIDLVDDGFNIRSEIAGKTVKTHDDGVNIETKWLRGVDIIISKGKRFELGIILDYVLTVISYMYSKGFNISNIYATSDQVENNIPFIIKKDKLFKKYGDKSELNYNIKELVIKFTL